MDSSVKPENVFCLDAQRVDWHGLSSYLRQRIEEQFESQVSSINLIEPLKSALDYAIFPAGKRIRPLIAGLICHDLKGDLDKLLEVVIALELLHCASLIHDDLPALDNDDLRRGKPTCHKAFGEASAILAGDILVPLAFKFIVQSSFDSDCKVKLSSILADCYIDLCQGQQLDLLPVNSAEKLEQIHSLKTGALFKAACLFAAQSKATIDQATLPNFAELGLKIGLLFQLLDDLLDLQSNSQLKGRAESSDLRNKKTTLATSASAAESKQKITVLRHEITEIFTELEACSNSYTTFSSTKAFVIDLVLQIEELV